MQQATAAAFLALFARFTECKFRKDCAVTAEITLTGCLFPVGSVEEKLQAAKDNGIKRVILSQMDYEKLSDAWKRDTSVEIVYAKSALELINYCLEDGQGEKTWTDFPENECRSRDA